MRLLTKFYSKTVLGAMMLALALIVLQVERLHRGDGLLFLPFVALGYLAVVVALFRYVDHMRVLRIAPLLYLQGSAFALALTLVYWIDQLFEPAISARRLWWAYILGTELLLTLFATEFEKRKRPPPSAPSSPARTTASAASTGRASQHLEIWR